MKRSIAASTLLLALLVLLAPATRAGQEVGTWEFHLFGGKAALDNEDPLAKTKVTTADFDGDGIDTEGEFRRSLDMKDDGFAGFRLGYVWTPQFELEISYDRNHAGGSYRQTIEDFGPPVAIHETKGRVSSVITSYQVGG